MKANIFIICFAIIVSGCQSSPSSLHGSTIEPPLLDEKFPGYQNFYVESEDEIFALDDDMKLMVAEKLTPEQNIKRRALKLLKFIFNSENISLTYARNANVTARQAFHNQQANCLSLTILAYSLAKEANLAVSFQQINTPEYWVRNGRYNFLTGHVNLLVKQKQDHGKSYNFGSDGFQIDFDPLASKSTFKRAVIDKEIVLAMFYNNKGAQALVEKNYAKAYHYFKTSVDVAPYFSQTWGNLGVLYKLTNQIEEAELTYRYAVDLNDKNLTALENLSILLFQEQNFEEATTIKDKLQTIRRKNPYYYALLADDAFYSGNNATALLYYKKAIKLDRNVHEFYFGLAKVYSKMNEIRLAQESIERAILHNNSRGTNRLYTAKLNYLKDAAIEN